MAASRAVDHETVSESARAEIQRRDYPVSLLFHMRPATHHLQGISCCGLREDGRALSRARRNSVLQPVRLLLSGEEVPRHSIEQLRLCSMEQAVLPRSQMESAEREVSVERQRVDRGPAAGRAHGGPREAHLCLGCPPGVLRPRGAALRVHRRHPLPRSSRQARRRFHHEAVLPQTLRRLRGSRLPRLLDEASGPRRDVSV